MCWDDSQDWNVGIDGYISRRGGQEGRGGHVSFYSNDHLESVELHFGGRQGADRELIG